MPDDECPDFDKTLRNMLSTPPTPHKPRVEPENDGDDVVEAHEGEEEGDES